jgi:hypothetical protein
MSKSIIYHAHGRNVEIPEEFAHLISMKSRKEIASEYDIPVWTLGRRIKEHKLVLSRQSILPIEDVVEIYLVLHWPFKMRQVPTSKQFPAPSNKLP